MSAFDWDDLRFFLAVARAGRLTVAARQLEADHTTVSRRISALEQALKAQLFERKPQGYSLTEQGERLLGLAESMETQALAVASEVGGADLALSGTVRIGAPDGIGTYFLAPELGALAERHPDLTLQLVALPRTFSLSKREADIAPSPCPSARPTSP
jgi:DNA-binding transcriptional LysR family regulator